MDEKFNSSGHVQFFKDKVIVYGSDMFTKIKFLQPTSNVTTTKEEST